MHTHTATDRESPVRQPMCWTAEGAHLLLQVCCAVLDGRLDALFRELYPRFRLTSPALELPGL
jgi:hypothetical protein